MDDPSDVDCLSSSMASSFSYAHLTEEEKHRILMGHNSGQEQANKGPSLGGVNRMAMMGGLGLPNIQ